MRKSFVALPLMFGAAALMMTTAFAQQSEIGTPEILVNGKSIQERKSRASRLGTTAPGGVDTTYVGHTMGAGPNSGAPWYVGTGPYLPGISTDGIWTWDNFRVGETDSLQGWWPIRMAYNATGGLTLSDASRPWWCLDHGNQVNYRLNQLNQARTTGVLGVWHVDGGNGAPAPGGVTGPSWAPLVGSGSAWCGLRAHGDNTYTDAITKNPFNGDTHDWNGINGPASSGGTDKNWPGYAGQWDQLLYRDVRVANGGVLNLSFRYKTKMSNDRDLTASTRSGWFDKDPTSLAAGNLISSTNAGDANAPIDSFMVYVGRPANPTSYRRADGSTGNVIYDSQRRWFSEVIDITSAGTSYREVFTVWGDADNGGLPVNVALNNAQLQPILDADGSSADGGGVVRIVFRSKTNRGWDDANSVSTGYSSGTEGAVRIDAVTVNAGGPNLVNSGFETAGEINNTVEAPNSASPGPAVGSGYALGSWHSTGKPTQVFFHTHPIFGGNIGGGNVYTPLAYNELCGPPDSPARFCNIGGVVISAGDHDAGERAGGVFGTAEQERIDGIVSPTINLVTSGGSNNVQNPADPPNGYGIDGDDVDVTDDYYIFYDMYAGVFNLSFSGNAWNFAFMGYPATQTNGTKAWGALRVPPFIIFNPEPQCFTDWEGGFVDGLVATSNASGYPDSLRIYLGKQQQCFRFGVSLGCSPTGGCYFDNVALGMIDAGPPLATNASSAVGSVSVSIWHFYNDAFPRNATPGLPGTAAFDTCGALLQTGINIAQATGTATRFDIPGDTVRVRATGANMRVDMIFRIKPGPGNYVTYGTTGSGLAVNPSHANGAGSAVTPGDATFWGQYMADPGAFSKGTHAGGWNKDTWNSARCDSAEANLFPAQEQGNISGPNTGDWATMYHESDPKFSALGITKNRCFLVTPSGALNSTNITCSSVPAWTGGAGTGYDGVATTKEYTKIIPDGLLTPGSHVEYFFRKQEGVLPPIAMCPDTNFITPQNGETSTDGHRWQQFGILPDRWKSSAYGGLGDACMLYVDFNDRRGNERTWVGVADTLGATAASKYGAHNGWHRDGSYTAAGTDDYANDNVGGNTAITVMTHGGQPGTTWDMYGVKASESLTTSGGALGNRLATQATGLAAGKDAKQGPTPEMLRTYYRILMILTGDLNSGILGPFVNRSQNDVLLLQDYMQTAGGTAQPRGVFVQGDGFAQSETQTGGIDPAHTNLLTTYFGLSLRDGSYQSVSGNLNDEADLFPTTFVSPRGDVFGLQNNCLFSNDLLKAEPGGTAASFYQNVGVNGPYVASVRTSTAAKLTLVDGWEIEHLRSRFDENSFGRLVYFQDVFTNVFGSLCAVVGTPTVDVPSNTRSTNFLRLMNNPLSSGSATVNFGLVKKDQVEVKVYDVTGRLVRVLANRTFEPGTYSLVWDGTNDAGQQVSRGVYFTQVKYINSKFVDAKKLTVLK